MDAGVGSATTNSLNFTPREQSQCGIQFFLNGNGIFLDLPTCVCGSFKREAQKKAGHQAVIWFGQI
jgi:hypothetical protein